MTPIDANALRMNVATVRTLDELLHVCGDAVERGFDKQMLAEMLSDVAQRHFDRYFLFSQAATSERHRWDEAWPDAANPKERGKQPTAETAKTQRSNL